MCNRNEIHQAENVIIEVYGIAGAGKSTYVKKNNNMVKVNVSVFLKLRVLLRLLTHDLRPLLRLTFRFRDPDRRGIVFFIFYKLNAAELLARKGKLKYIYDQGPIYNLSRLLYKSTADEWQKNQSDFELLLQRIRNAYDETVYLRCPVDIVMERILNRDKSHFAQKVETDEARSRLSKWEQSYEFIQAKLNSNVIENY